MAKKFIAPVPYDTLLGKYVRVFKNLHNGLYSVQHKGIVIAHVQEICLLDVNFKVQPAGRAKVVATKQKNVHAFVSGTVAPFEALQGTQMQKVRYDPYLNTSFVVRGPLGTKPTPVHEAQRVEVLVTGVWMK